MKTEKPFILLLLVTVLTSVLVVLLGAVFREDYPVKLAYEYPVGEKESTLQAQPSPVPSAVALPEAVPSSAEEEVLFVLEEDEEEAFATVTFPLELNQATYAELLQIPKVGEVTATRILQYRQQLGGFADISQLLEIKGIGEASYATISAYVYVTGDAWDTARTPAEDLPTDADLEGFNHHDSNG